MDLVPIGWILGPKAILDAAMMLPEQPVELVGPAAAEQLVESVVRVVKLLEFQEHSWF